MPKPASLSPAELVETALDAMTASLDPHSGYLNAQEFNESFVHTKGEFGGLGIEVTMEDGLVKVVAPIEDTPAARAGMLSGDLIVKVDGGAIKGLTLAQAVRRMRGRPGAPIKLLV
ncbi:MAG: PDZ domain-containing protein, partial [Rhodospirillaceae bacterium]|nr:PDZ domain-containing protein [Rhodospirillaceae bacterium]